MNSTGKWLIYSMIAWAILFATPASFALKDDRQGPKLPKRVDAKPEPARHVPSAEQKRLADLAAKEGVNTDWHSRLGTPISVRGKGLGQKRSFSTGKGLAVKGGNAYETDAVAVLDNLSGVYDLKDAGKEFAIDRTDSDTQGFHHVRLHQLHEGLRVVGGDVIVHFNKDGDAHEVNGRYLRAITLKTAPRIGAADAVAAALKDVPAADSARAVASKTELVVYALDCDPALAYELTVSYGHGKTGPGRWRYWIDAIDASILMRFNDIKTIAAPTSNGSSTTITGSLLEGEGGASVSFSGWFENTGVYYLYNKALHWYVFNITSSGSWTDKNTYAYRSTSAWGITDRAEISAAKGLDLVQNYYLQVHGRNSFDSGGAYARANVHEGSSYVNAYWDSTDFHFGDGDAVEANSLAVLDIIGHEFTHAVTENSTANLTYLNESGALNESYSDIFGTCIEFHCQPDGRDLYPGKSAGTADWLLGEDCWISSKSLRDMRSPSNPLTVGAGNEQPSRYKGTYWYYGSGDNGGVHQNSGVQNFLFYLVSDGAIGTNDGLSYNIVGIGLTNAAKVAYRALTVYCTPGTDYEANRAAWMSAAEDLNPDWTGTIAAAWNAVGVSAGLVTVATPTFNPGEGAYASSVTVTVATATAGATIHYTTNGIEPTESSTVYTAPIVLTNDLTLKAKAFTTGMLPSQTKSAHYAILGTLIWNVPMDSSPGWTIQGQWAFGQPTGGGGEHGSPDPTSGHTGTSVYGYNLSGDYANSIVSTYWLTTTAIDLSSAANTKLLFWRWLGVERPAYDHAYVDVSNNGSTWTRIWENSTEIADSQWNLQVFDIAAVADLRSTFYVRWGMGPTDSSYRYCGWNIDDVAIWGDPVAVIPPASPTNLVASALSGTTVWLRWDDRSNNEEGFAIERKTGAGSWSEIARVGANTVSALDTNAVATVTYMYQIRAYNPSGNSNYSNQSTVTTPSGTGDAWDPGDDTGTIATILATPLTPVQTHGPHTLSGTDFYDWFSVNLIAGYAYNFNSAGGSGDTYAELYT
ncbi:MAG: M4 family metallopeptidase, partial [bacterium]